MIVSAGDGLGYDAVTGIDCVGNRDASTGPDDGVEEWLTREYTEIHSGETVMLSCEYNGKVLSPQTLSSVIWRHYFHPEDKSLSPEGELFAAIWTRNTGLDRHLRHMCPLH